MRNLLLWLSSTSAFSAFLLQWLIAASVIAATPEELTPYGVPDVPGAQTTQINRSSYVIKYFNACKAPFYTAQHLEGKNVGGNEERIQFKSDPDLPFEIRAVNADYLGSGYDKGHMAPAADFQSDPVGMAESFILSNAVPQTPQLNRGPWKRIEMRTRAYAVKYGELYVFTGAIYPSRPSTIGSGVCVPSHTYKVVIDKKTNQSIGYLAMNTRTATGRSEQYQVPVNKIEQLTGINFTPKLDPAIADAMKSSIGQKFIVK